MDALAELRGQLLARGYSPLPVNGKKPLLRRLVIKAPDQHRGNRAVEQSLPGCNQYRDADREDADARYRPTR